MAREVPSIQPTVGGLGQYSVGQRRAAAVPVPRSKALDLADSINAFMGVAKSYGQLADTQYKLGLEQSALVEEQQEIEQLNNTKDLGFFDPLAMNARNRGVRDGLLKRYISNTMVPNLDAKTDELIDVQKYTEDTDFYAAVDSEINKEWEGLVNQVGDKIANTTAAKALWSQVAPTYRANLIAKFEKAKQAFIEDTQDEDSMSDLRAATQKIEGPMTVDKLQNLITNREEIMKESGIIDPGTRQKILLNSHITQANTLLTNGRYKDTEAFIQSMIGAKVNNRKVFGSTESQVKINSVITKLEEARKEDNKLSDSKKQQLFAGYYDIASEGISGLQRDGKLEDSHITAIKTTIESLSPALRNNPKEVQSLVDQIASSTNP